MNTLRRIIAFIFPLLLMSCLWDRDTLRTEMEGREDVVKVLTGWFDRYPPVYYESRLERVTREITSTPSQLGLYDDAGVACDRLGRSGEAIEWMVKKKQQLDSHPNVADWKEQEYRYLANLGTFHVHRWLISWKKGENPPLDDLEKGEALVAEAIEKNPEAHFGREKYQLNVLRLLLDDDFRKALVDKNTVIITEHISQFVKKSEDHDEAVSGYTGLIELGAAWESPLIYKIIMSHFGKARDSHLSLITSQRIEELKWDYVFFSNYKLEKGLRDSTVAFYRKARAASESRQEKFTQYIQTGIEQDQHPDTHEHFWKDWVEPEFPAVPSQSLFTVSKPYRTLKNILLILGLIFFLIVSFMILRSCRRMFRN